MPNCSPPLTASHRALTASPDRARSRAQRLPAPDGKPSSALIDQVSDQLIHLLSLRACRFEYGVAGLGKPARLERNGQVTVGNRAWDTEHDGLPTETELLVEAGGILQGRFLFRPEPTSRPTLEQRLVAMAPAEQVGAAIAAGHPASRS